MYKIETIEDGDSEELAEKKREKNVLVNQYYGVIDEMHEVDAKGELTYGKFDDYLKQLRGISAKISVYGFENTVERLLKSVYGLGLEIGDKKVAYSHKKKPNYSELQKLENLRTEANELYHGIKDGKISLEQGWKMHDDIFERSRRI